MNHPRDNNPTPMLALVMAALLAIACPALAADIYSNGFGGGAWSDPSSWRGGKAPTSADDVTISRGDVITFDRDDDQAISANKLFIDPDGTLAFKTAGGKITLTLADALECYGRVQMDVARVHGDALELRMTGKTPPQRTITLMKGGSLTIIGRRFLNVDQASAILSSRPENKPFPPESQTLSIDTKGQAAIDLRNALLQGVSLSATDIDNTSNTPGQRLNIVGNTFLGFSSVTISRCDTPLLADNTFTNPHPRLIDMACIMVSSSPLATIRNNVFDAFVRDAITCTSMVDPLIQGNVIRKASRGILVQLSANAMIQGNQAIGCSTGYYVRLHSGMVRDNLADGCAMPFVVSSSNHQMIGNRVVNLAPDKPILSYVASKVSLYNTPVTADRFQAVLTNGETRLIAHQPLIVRVKGQLPRGSVVEVSPVESDLKLSAAIPPVVNSPASLDAQGSTPVMATQRALMVRTWMFEQQAGKQVVTDPPRYRIRVLAPDPAAGQDGRKELASQVVEPSDNWYRADPADATPSVEITLR